MTTFFDISQEIPPHLYSKEAHACLLGMAGHYRVDRFNQPILEDLRQRLAHQRGVSLETFRAEYLPIILNILQLAKDKGHLTDCPPLFDYCLPPLLLNECWSAWLDSISERVAPATVRRYRNILNQWLLPMLAELDLCALDGAGLQNYHALFLKQGGSESSFKFHITILYGILDFEVGRAIDATGLFQPDVPPLLFKSVVPLWLAWLEENGSPEQVKFCRAQLEQHLLPSFQLSDLRGLNQRHVEDYRVALARQGIGTDVLRKHLNIINSIRQFAVSQGLLESAQPLFPDREVSPVAARLPDRRVLEQICQLDSADPAVLIIRLAWQLGLRYEEIRTLKWQQVDLDHREAVIAGRTIPIPEDLAQCLAKIAAESGPAGYIVLSRQKQGPISVPYLFRLARELLSRLELPAIQLKDMRNSYVVQLLQDHTLAETASLCGCSDMVEMRRLYADFLPKQAEIEPVPAD